MASSDGIEGVRLVGEKEDRREDGIKKMVNAPADFVQETVKGIIAAYRDRLTLLNGDLHVVISNRPGRERKVGIVAGEDSGHLPLFLGYVGDGMVDGCAMGNVLVSPSANRMSELIKACDFGNGVLYLYGNYGGDNMNFKITCDEAGFENIETRIITAADDVASAPAELARKRRGVVGLIYAYKITGAAAGERRSLSEVADAAKKALGNIQNMGVALSPCIVPEVGEPTFSIPDDEIEIGIGIHGEKGTEVCKMLTADETAAVILRKIMTDMQLEAGDEVSVMVNGLGAAPLEEQMILYRTVHRTLDEIGMSVFVSHIGKSATSIEMVGLSVTMFKLNEELKQLLRAPASTPFYTSANK